MTHPLQINVDKPKVVMTKAEAKKKIEYMRAKDAEIVKGIFRFHECPGGTMSFVFSQYGEQPDRYDLVDGQVYSVPLGVARHLNKNCWYPEYGFVPGEKGLHGAFNNDTGTYMRVTTKVRRCSFQSLDFMDTDDLTPVGLAEVTAI